MQEGNRGSRDGSRRDSSRRGGSGRYSGRRDGGHGFNSGGFRPRRDFNENREMHKATCSDCGQECEVPFKPTEGKPVYCKECFRKNKNF